MKYISLSQQCCFFTHSINQSCYQGVEEYYSLLLFTVNPSSDDSFIHISVCLLNLLTSSLRHTSSQQLQAYCSFVTTKQILFCQGSLNNCYLLENCELVGWQVACASIFSCDDRKPFFTLALHHRHLGMLGWLEECFLAMQMCLNDSLDSQLVKSFTLLGLSGKLAIFIFIHHNIYEFRVKLATFKTSYLNQRKWPKLVLMNTLCVQGMLNIFSYQYQVVDLFCTLPSLSHSCSPGYEIRTGYACIALHAMYTSQAVGQFQCSLSAQTLTGPRECGPTNYPYLLFVSQCQKTQQRTVNI